jgi:hypothetical protein
MLTASSKRPNELGRQWTDRLQMKSDVEHIALQCCILTLTVLYSTVTSVLPARTELSFVRLSCKKEKHRNSRSSHFALQDSDEMSDGRSGNVD